MRSLGVVGEVLCGDGDEMDVRVFCLLMDLDLC